MSVEVGGLFKNIKKTEKDKKFKEIQMSDVITIRVKTVSPLLQMDSEGLQRKRYVVENGHFYREPFWSANGFRGALRRVATKTLGDAVAKKEPGFTYNAENMYLYASGAGADKKSIEKVTPVSLQCVREKAPILSLFGAGLSQISGKTAVSDLRVSDNQENGVDKYRIVEKNDKEYAFSNFLESHTYYRDDVAVKQGVLSNLIDQEDINEWIKEHYKAVVVSKEAKKSSGDNNAKESESHMQQPVTVECITPGTMLTTCINPISGYDFTDIELGCLVKSLVTLAPLQIGAAKRYGYGRLDWEVAINGEALFELERDSDFTANYSMTVTDKAKELMGVYEKWLEDNATSENIDIANIIKSC